MNAYYNNTNIGVKTNNSHISGRLRIGDKLISFICAVVAILTCSAAIKIEKALLCTGLFFGFFGITGSMENGSIGLFTGLLLCAAIAFIEFLVFRNLVFAPSQKNSKS